MIWSARASEFFAFAAATNLRPDASRRRALICRVREIDKDPSGMPRERSRQVGNNDGDDRVGDRLTATFYIGQGPCDGTGPVVAGERREQKGDAESAAPFCSAS
jgi:hypothetical protein